VARSLTSTCRRSGGVAVDSAHDRGLVVDAGRLPQQGDVHAQAAATRRGAGRAAFEHGHGHPEPGQRDGRRHADQAAARHHAVQGRTGRCLRRAHTAILAQGVPGRHQLRLMTR